MKDSIKNIKINKLILVVLCGVFYYIESLMPNIFTSSEGVRLGLCNIFILLALFNVGFLYALIMCLISTLILPIFVGITPSLLYSLTPSLMALFGMYLIIKSSKDYFGFIGISIIGAIVHNVSCLIIVSLVLSTFAVYNNLPSMLVLSILAGSITGLFTYLFDRYFTITKRKRIRTEDKG